jgi:hypothetical protein
MRGRRHLGGLVTDDAYQGWHDTARSHGVTVAALLETCGLWLGEQNGRLNEPWEGIVAAARDLAANRRAR